MAAPTPPGFRRAAAPKMRAIMFDVPKPATSKPIIAPAYVVPTSVNPKPETTKAPICAECLWKHQPPLQTPKIKVANANHGRDLVDGKTERTKA